MISETDALAIAQAYLDERPYGPVRCWIEAEKREVILPAEPLKASVAQRTPFGYLVGYNTVTPGLAGHRPLYVSADGREVRGAKLAEIWEADPAASPDRLPFKDRLIEMEEEGLREGNPWTLKAIYL